MRNLISCGTFYHGCQSQKLEIKELKKGDKKKGQKLKIKEIKKEIREKTFPLPSLPSLS